MIDLRSDTVTRPSDKMRAAMAAAEVGDDVFGDDPTVNRLQERAAEIFRKEAALWVPTGCMANELAVKVHTKAGQEIITEERSHILNFEASAGLSRPFSELSGQCESVMFTLSKGLGAPAGSVLLGSAEFIQEARIWRKRLGGGMRQVGILAAAGLIALEEGPQRLFED